MRGLILNRNKYIVEKNKRIILRKNASLIFPIVLAIIGGVVFFGAKNIWGVTNNPGDEKGPENAIDYHNQNDNVNSGDHDNTVPESGNREGIDKKPNIIRRDVPETYLVTKVVDGDTIYVAGIETRIRLIGVNTPETNNPSKPVQCYGPEASSYLTSLLLGKNVGLESDAASGEIDPYGRPLRYVYYNGENVNQKLIMEGYGKEADYGSEYKYRLQFVESEKYAFINGKGLWSLSTCGGQE